MSRSHARIIPVLANAAVDRSEPCGKWKSLARPSAALLIALLASACASAGGANPSVQSTSAASATAAAASPTLAATIGKPADDGARVIAVETLDDRTTDLTIDSPAVGTVKVRLLLPTGFAARPSGTWPTLYLLHGSPGSHVDWTGHTDVDALTASSDLLIAMPDGGNDGWYSDWWNGGTGGPPMWETFHTVELPQLLERDWRASDKRVIAGYSMGGYGAIAYAERHPGMFLAAASYSGVLDPISAGPDNFGSDLWGDPTAQADVWKAHDPISLASALKGTALYVSYGDGQLVSAGPLNGGKMVPDDIEGFIHDGNVTFLAKLDALEIPVTVDAYGAGSHTWPYWERALHRSLPHLTAALGM